ncbi:MAG TPA: hypothetical protein VHL31_11515 [Geminicoccus sp.]|jgi:hypothetical protein|uniref:hypothetical protein n=1 Tax=Geminicoccus sp. TaxID=2024832 RepID=UPI002E3147E2|nr:hypothetical protein [Geminicoccus sp.]HEX2526907.1 hypothetical protein [Geminicoccus sp.]
MMSDMDDALKELGEVDRDILQIETRITEQTVLAEHLRTQGQSNTEANKAGQNLEKVLREQHMHRELVLARIAQLEES